MAFADRERHRGGTHALDVGCGAGRNAVPLAQRGWQVTGLDLTWAMLRAAAERERAPQLDNRLRLVLAPMDQLPVRDGSCDLVIAHGIWNLARSAAEFRRAVREAARVARAGAGLFLFTFSRRTLPPDARPVPGEPFVFTQFSGEPQCFLTEEQLLVELGSAGFLCDPSVPFTEYNVPRPGSLPSGAPVIYEATFRRGRDAGRPERPRGGARRGGFSRARSEHSLPTAVAKRTNTPKADRPAHRSPTAPRLRPVRAMSLSRRRE
jgi:SAM-dependent methyltransferase